VQSVVKAACSPRRAFQKRRLACPHPLPISRGAYPPSPLAPLPVPGERNRMLPSPLDGRRAGDEGKSRERFRVVALRTLKSPATRVFRKAVKKRLDEGLNRQPEAVPADNHEVVGNC
jgi:hypothetical protein